MRNISYIREDHNTFDIILRDHNSVQSLKGLRQLHMYPAVSTKPSPRKFCEILAPVATQQYSAML